MASMRPVPNGGWQVRWRDLSGKQKARNFGPNEKTRAKTFKAEVETDLKRGTYIDPHAGTRITFQAYAEEWIAAQPHKPTTRGWVRAQFKNHIYPTFGDRPLSSIRTTEIQTWLTKLYDHLSISAANITYRYVAATLRSAVIDKLLVSTPCLGIKLRHPQPKKITIPDTATVQAIIAATPQPYRTLITLAAATGLRQGELFGLQRRHIDLARREVHVEQQVQIIDGTPQVTTPKSRTSVRTVPLPNIAVTALAHHLAEYVDDDEAAYLFTDDADEMIRRHWFRQHIWRPSLTRAAQTLEDGTPAGAKRAQAATGVTLHMLRHFYASVLIEHGENVRVVQERLGHASATITLNIYVHLWDSTEDRSRSAIDSVLGTPDDDDGTSGVLVPAA